MRVTKYITAAVVASSILVGFTGCGSDVPDTNALTQVMDRGLDKTFESANNRGNPFTVSNMKIVKMQEVSEGKYHAVVDFNVEAINSPAKMAMTMTYGNRIMQPLRRLKTGNSVELKGIEVVLVEFKDTYKISKAQ